MLLNIFLFTTSFRASDRYALFGKMKAFTSLWKRIEWNFYSMISLVIRLYDITMTQLYLVFLTVCLFCKYFHCDLWPFIFPIQYIHKIVRLDEPLLHSDNFFYKFLPHFADLLTNTSSILTIIDECALQFEIYLLLTMVNAEHPLHLTFDLSSFP